MDDMIEK